MSAEDFPYVEDHRIFDFLKSQMELTSYEASALIAIIFGSEQPSAIAEAAKIPRSKVYGTLDALESRGLITKWQRGGYQPNSTLVVNLKEQARTLTKQYLNYIERLHAFSVGTPRIASTIRENIVEILKNNSFTLDSPQTLFEKDEVDGLEHLRQRIFSEIHYLTERLHLSDVEIYAKELMDLAPNFIDFIGESSTSGLRVGIVILTGAKKPKSPQGISILIDSVSVFCGCQSIFVILTPEISPSYIKEFQKFENEIKHRSPRPFRERIKIELISSVDNYEIQLDEYLKNIDFQWRDLKTGLVNLEEEKDELKGKIRSNLVKIDDLLHSSISNNQYKEVYDDIFQRIKIDLQVYETMIVELESELSFNFNTLNNKHLFSRRILSSNKNRLAELERSVDEKSNEISGFAEELFSINPEKNPYMDYGFSVNPFSIIVPRMKPTVLINQVKQVEKAEKFVNSITEGAIDNLLFIVGKEGGGKSHFLNYYKTKINNNEYSKAFAIKIQCRPKRDLVDLYPQITTEVIKVAKEKNDPGLSEILTELLAEIGTPRIISDLMKIIRVVSVRLSNLGYSPLFIMIDEFENALAPTKIAGGHFMPNRYFMNRESGTSQAISQLESLTQMAGIGFIVVMREEMWKKWHNEIKSRVSKFENSLVNELESLSLTDSTSLMNHRLNNPYFKVVAAKTKSPKFSDDAIKFIWENAGGNPRKMLRLARKGFRRAVSKSETEITKKFVMD